MIPRWSVAGAAAMVAAGLAAGAAHLNAIARAPSGYVAKTLCSEVFVAGREEADVLARDFTGIDAAIDRVRARLDAPGRNARASLFGLGAAQAVYRDGYGCTIVAAGPPAPVAAAPARGASPAWPQALTLFPALPGALDEAMADTELGHRAFLVVADGMIVGERYAQGFSPDTPFLSWSMAKSVTATLVGAAALRGYLDIADPAPVEEWREGDPRRAIAWNDLLQMQSGLAFSEIYDDPTSDASEMLFRARDAGRVAARGRLLHPPGERWAYSSGTTNLIARALRGALAAHGADYHAFPHDALFAPIGAASATLEVDSAGNFLGSSFMYATARDWARLGQLYLQDGVWNGTRLLPEGWAAYVREPASDSDGRYGAHFWLNRDGAERERYLPGLPEDVYFMAGHEGQYVIIAPDRNAVIVRTGTTRGRVPIEAVAPAVKRIYDALERPGPARAP